MAKDTEEIIKIVDEINYKLTSESADNLIYIGVRLFKDDKGEAHLADAAVLAKELLGPHFEAEDVLVIYDKVYGDGE